MSVSVFFIFYILNMLASALDIDSNISLISQWTWMVGHLTDMILTWTWTWTWAIFILHKIINDKPDVS